MARYKKKRHNRLLSPPKKRPKNTKIGKIENIEMTSSSKRSVNKQQKNMRVVSGKRKNRGIRLGNLAFTAAVIVIIALAVNALFPAGIVQTLSNTFAVMGKGSYPISVSGAETLDVVSYGNYYFHLTDTYISGYAASGKELFSTPHGFERPALVSSKGRILVYDVGGNQFHIFDLTELKETVETENEIIGASISDSGNYAVATYSDKFAAAVTVYSKKGKMLFEWYSAEDTVNNVAISPNGKKIAVSTFNSQSGVFNSKVNIINYKSATPEHSATFEGTLIYGLKGSNNKGFFVIKSKGTEFITWSKYDTNVYSDDYSLSMFRTIGSKSLAVFNRESDKTDNKIVVYSKKGKAKYTVKYKGIINDISVKGSNIYSLGDSHISVLDFGGNVKFTADCDYGGKGIAVTSASVAAVINDSEIQRIKLSKEEDG